MLRAAALTAVLFAAATANAQTRHSAAPVQVAASVHVAAYGAPVVAAGSGDRVERRDDRRDLRVLEGLLADYDAARARRSALALRRVEDRVRAELAAELAEERGEVRDDRDERSGRREVKEERRDLQQTRRILREFEGLAGRTDRRALQAKRGLLAEAVSLAREELADSRRDEQRRPGRRG